jgi:hypothetical protein|tara:strand:- start:845 stop:1141 length:297 start_codon:yes stop_codon:yes gene_type:complete
MAYLVNIETLDDLSEIYSQDLSISQAIAMSILDNLNTTRRWVPALEIYISNSDKTFNYSVDRQSFIPVLEKCLKVHEIKEDYETCHTINKAIQKLKKQ